MLCKHRTKRYSLPQSAYLACAKQAAGDDCGQAGEHKGNPVDSLGEGAASGDRGWPNLVSWVCRQSTCFRNRTVCTQQCQTPAATNSFFMIKEYEKHVGSGGWAKMFLNPVDGFGMLRTTPPLPPIPSGTLEKSDFGPDN